MPGENAEASHKLSILIQDFISKGDLANRRNFPEPRLGKIVVDSVASFEWTHCEMWNFAKQGQRRQRTANDDTLMSALLAVMNRKRNGPDRGDKTKAVLLIKCIWNDQFLNGEAKACMIDHVRQYLRQHVFSPWRIRKAMDIAGFKLSLAGIEVLRNAENSSKYGRCTLPSKSTILRYARKLEAAASEICPFTMIGRTFQNSNQQHHEGDGEEEGLDDDNTTILVGEGFEFDAAMVTKTLFKAFGLMDEAKRRSVELGLASDGAADEHSLSRCCRSQVQRCCNEGPFHSAAYASSQS